MKFNFPYVALRLIRHFIPYSGMRFFLDRQFIIRPGLETRAPQVALDRYLQALVEAQFSIKGKRVLVFGYGGTFTIGCEFLKAGAGHVTLLDRFVKPNNQQNLALLPTYAEYLQREGQKVITRPTYLSVIDGDVCQLATNGLIPPVDLIVSSSVFEHLVDVDGITRALAALTKPDGIQLHFIDLRDHYFKYPFEMLTYSDNVWKKWLNPTSNLNRYRLPDYQLIFQKNFEAPHFSILDRNIEAFQASKPRIRSEFLTGDLEVDSVTALQVLARSPRPATGSPS